LLLSCLLYRGSFDWLLLFVSVASMIVLKFLSAWIAVQTDPGHYSDSGISITLEFLPEWMNAVVPEGTSY